MSFQSDILRKLFITHFGEEAIKTEALPRSGSSRQYVRLAGNNFSAIGAYNTNLNENLAYISFTKTFRQHKINVPEIFITDTSGQYYLVEDLGTTSLYDFTILCKGNLTHEVKDFYKKSLANLVDMQFKAGPHIDYAKCYPVSRFDETAIQWDLNYFKYNFLKLSSIDFDEYLLEKDFDTLRQYLINIPAYWFMFRDFQSRNILIKDNQPWYIDFQGGRKGPLVYDVASLLYQAKARFTEALRDELFASYHSNLTQYYSIDYSDLYQQFKAFALLRTLQVLGAYGFRGYFEKKPHFIESIPFAIENLNLLLQAGKLNIELLYLTAISEKLSKINHLQSEPDKLTISVFSFSYRKGIPADTSGNGGGFVFDCRGVNNPGRFAEYQFLTGKDAPVINFFKEYSNIDDFLGNILTTVKPTIETYLNRGFKHLMVSFGCTGGQHRSVYCAQNFAEYVSKEYQVRVVLCHREQNETLIYE